MRKLLSDPKRFTGRSMGRKHLLSGIAYCGECGRRMGTTVRRLKSGGNRPVYQCKNVGCMRMVRDLAKTDELVIGVITERLADPDAARKLSKPTVDTKALHDQIDTLRKLITATREEYTEGLIDARDRNARIERITEKLSPLEDKLLGSHMSRDVKDLAGSPMRPSGSRCRWTAVARGGHAGHGDHPPAGQAGWPVRPRGDHRRLEVIGTRHCREL